MKKYTNKKLRELVKEGVAINIASAKKRADIPERYEQIGYAADIYGCSGMLLRGYVTGQLYAVASRVPSMYLF